MVFEDYYNLLSYAFKENGLEDLLNEEKGKKLYSLSKLLIETNKSYNLTAITDENEIILKHYLDCATLCRHIASRSKVADIGCGAGFPTLPLAILREDVHVTALDSTGKKINFVEKAAFELELNNVTAVCARAEEHVTECRESFDICTSRAVARLNVLAELCLPYLRTSGTFVAMKAGKGQEEHLEAIKGVEKLGGKFVDSYNYSLTFGKNEVTREIYLYKKTSKTPPQFPRKYSQIIKKPL